MSPGTKKCGIRIPDVLWAEYQEATTAAGLNASETIRGMIRDWLTTNKQGEK